MLGYVRAYKPELKFKEYDVYKGVYCTLCKTLLRRYSPFGQLLLSYDATFFALLLLSVSEMCPATRPSRCCWNPCKKCYSCGKGETLDFCADMSVILFYYKIMDDLRDRGAFKKLLALLLFPSLWLMHRKAARLRPEAEAIVRDLTQRQTELEKTPDCALDAAAEPSADGLRRLGALYCRQEDFGRLLYLLGRFVYLIDAVDDAEKDVRSGNFNPLKAIYLQDKDAFPERAMEMLNLNISEMLRSFDAIPFKRYEEIIYNVLFNGLYNSAKYVMNPNPKDRRRKHE